MSFGDQFYFNLPLREKCPYSKLFWSVFFRIRTEYGEITPNNSESEYGLFLCRVWFIVHVFSGMEFWTFSFLSLSQDVFGYLSVRRFFLFFFFIFLWMMINLSITCCYFERGLTYIIFWYNQNHSKQSLKNIIHRDIKSVKNYLSGM